MFDQNTPLKEILKQLDEEIKQPDSELDKKRKAALAALDKEIADGK
jgi:hypothetical protein